MRSFSIAISIALSWALALQLANGDQHEYNLIDDLLNNYDPLERPVRDFKQAVNVTMKIILQQIVGLDEKNQVIETNVWLQYDWFDYKLVWDQKEYNNVTDIRFPVGKIWKPDILLYNSADSNFDSTYPTNLIVYSNGAVNWVPPGILKSSCKVDITWFPFDDQNCYLKFGSWTYHGFALNLQINYPNGNSSNTEDVMDTSEYLENGEFLLVSTPARRQEKKFSCCPEPYPFVKFYMKIRRRTLYYGLNLIIPSLLISLMTVLGFTLPPDAGEKITLEITILLSVCFFLSIVSEMTPPTSEAVPLIGTFFSCCMLVVSASVVFTVVVLNLHYRSPETHEMSPFVSSVLLNWLPWALMMRRPGRKFNLATLRARQRKAALVEVESESLMRNVRSVEDGGAVMAGSAAVKPSKDEQSKGHNINTTAGLLGTGMIDSLITAPLGAIYIHRHAPTDNDNLDVKIENKLAALLNKGEHTDASVNALLIMLQRVLTELKYMTRRMESNDEEEDTLNDWKFAAMVVDRLCLVVFSAFIATSTCGIMFSAPHLSA